MGNNYSNVKNPFSNKEKIPSHLKPLKKKKKKEKQRPQPEEVSSSAENVLNSKGVIEEKKRKDTNKNKVPRTLPIPPVIALRTPAKPFMYDDDDADFVKEEQVLVGSGPRGAFRWFKGRRYLNYATKGGLDNSLLPNDQIELDRMRVLSFIIRWAFKGTVIAPVQDQLKQGGIKVLNVAFGPGMWTGDHIIDMAMDYPTSQFTAVDVCDLLPKDFEEEATKSLSTVYVTMHNTTSPAIAATTTAAASTASNTTTVNNMTMFTPMHPKLSTKLQNTTTPVIDSSNIDDSYDTSNSCCLSSQIEGLKIQDNKFNNASATASTTTTTTTTTTMTDSDDDNNADTTSCKSHLFINDEEKEADLVYIRNMEAPGQTNVTPVTKYRNLLPNLEFFQLNVVHAKLPFPDNTFDFVQQRLVSISYTVTNWKSVISELYRVIKPGGFIQLVEIDYNTFNLGPNGRRWEIHLLETARLKRQTEPRIAIHLPDILRAVGMINVESKLVSIPLGSWGLDLGNLWTHNLETFVESTAPLLSKLAGVSSSEFRQQFKTLFEEVQDKKPFTNIHAAWGKKSLDGPSNLDDITIDWSSVPPML